MTVRFILTDKAWEEIANILAVIKPKAGRKPQQSDRMFIEAVLYVARTGIPWRDLPADFGRWDAVYNRFRRWEANGVWKKLWKRLQADECKLAKHIFIDSTIVRAHQHAAGALKKNGGQAAQALGRSRGGFSTKIHAGCIDEKTGVSFVVTGGERNDMPGFDLVFDQVPQENDLEDAVMDKGYDSNHIRKRVKDNGMNPVIPSKNNRKEIIDYDKDKYKLREKVERFFNRLKQFRRIATRYDKLGHIFLAFIHIVAAYIIIKGSIP